MKWANSFLSLDTWSILSYSTHVEKKRFSYRATVEHNGVIKKYRNREKEILFMDLREMGAPFEKKYIQLTKENIKKIAETYHNRQQIAHA
jgi:heterodisulfide reductase subunit A-like polyferredoxin